MMFKSLQPAQYVGSTTKEQLNAQPQNAHYSYLYSCKHFRNRIIRLQQLCQQRNIDAIVLISGMDSRNDQEMTKLLNWLIYGYSCADIHGEPATFDFDDSFFVVAKDSLQIYTSNVGYQHLYKLITLVPNCSIFVLTDEERQDQERQEVLKVAKFYEMIHDKPVVGMPVRALTADDTRLSQETQIVEFWPLIQAYGLDVVGNGFFTMKHKWQNVREDLAPIYKELDNFSLYRVVFDEIGRLNQTYYDNFFNMNRKAAEKRLEQITEQTLISSFQVRYELSEIQLQTCRITHFSDGLPLPRVLVGPDRTNMPFDTLSDNQDKLWKFNNKDDKQSAIHFTLEHVDPGTGMRFCRTFFLTALMANQGEYMKGVYFTDDEEYRVPSQTGLKNQRNTQTLLGCYLALIRAYGTSSELFLNGRITVSQLQSKTADIYRNTLMDLGMTSEKAFHSDIAEHLEISVKNYDSFGQEQAGGERVNPKYLICIRMQVRDISSEYDQENLGSIIYANSFIYIDEATSINVTKNVPNLQQWHTNHKHYMNTPFVPILTEKNISCAQLGDKRKEDFFQDIVGFMPVKAELQSIIQRDIMLAGKLAFYEKGFIFTDQRLGAFVIPFIFVRKITFNMSDSGDWMQVTMNQFQGKNMLPAQLIAEEYFYLQMSNAFCNERFNTLTRLFKKLESQREEKDHPVPLIEKTYNACERVTKSFSYLNYIQNKKLYSVLSGSEYANFNFDRQEYREILDYHAIKEFNYLKGKVFIPFQQFSEVYRLVQETPKADYLKNTREQMSAKLKRVSPNQPISVILISGVPGSGKGRLASSLSKLLNNENLRSQFFKMPTVQQSIRYSTSEFTKAIIQDANQEMDVIVAALPAYHHLKKAIFELRKNEEFSQMFDIKFVITKVSAVNFFTNKNRNHYNFLIENCIKGVSHAVIFETSNTVELNEIAIMQRICKNCNFEDGILPVHGRHSFELESLSQILMRQNDKFNMLYTKYFYGFEREGTTGYYREGKNIQGHFLNYRQPIVEQLAQNLLQKLINNPVIDAQSLLPQTKEMLDAEEALRIEQIERVNAMDERQRRKYDAEKRKKERMAADLEAERLLNEQMDLTKRMVKSALPQNALVVERLRGLVRLEEGDDSQDYELVITSENFVLKPMKNSKHRLDPEDLGFLVYGRNVSESNDSIIKQLFRNCRRPQKPKEALRKIEDLKREEIDVIQAQLQGEDLPSGWFFDGRMYMDFDGHYQAEHPRLQSHLNNFLAEINSKIGDYNRQVQKEWNQDRQKYE